MKKLSTINNNKNKINKDNDNNMEDKKPLNKYKRPHHFIPNTNPSSCPGSCPISINKKLQNLVAPHIESFNYMLDEGLQLAVDMLLPLRVDLPNDEHMNLWIEKAEIGTPNYSIKDKNNNIILKPFLPRECRQKGISYTASLIITIGRSFGGVTDSSIHRNVEYLQRNVGDIPIMVKSKKCHLNTLKPSELIKVKEEANEMGGYFINNGNERCIRLLQMARRHHIMAIMRNSFVKRGHLYSNKAVFMRCVRRDQSAVTITIHYLHDGSATLRFTIQRIEYMIPVILIMKALYPITDKKIFDKIMGNDPTNSFLSLRIEILLRQCIHFDVKTREEALSYLGQHFRNVVPYIDNTMTNMEVGNRIIDEYIFVHLTNNKKSIDKEKSRAQKLELLCIMLRKLYLFVQGKICQDNPDSIMNHELLLPGHLYLNLLKENLQDTLLHISNQYKKELRIIESLKLNNNNSINNDKKIITKGRIIKTSLNMDIKDIIFLRRTWERTTNIGHEISYFLNTGNIRTRSGLDLMQITGFTIVAEKINFYRYFSHFRSVHRGQFFTTMKTTAIRKLLPDSWGFLCPVHTPDGSPCGLLNHLTVECKLVAYPPWTAENYHSNELLFARFLTTLGMTPSTGFTDGAFILPSTYLPIMFNGKLIGGASDLICKKISIILRHLKIENNDESKNKIRQDNGIISTMEICLILPVVGGPYPGLFLSCDAARMIRPVKQLDTNEIEYIGPMEQVFMDIACLKTDIIADVTTHIEIDPTNMLSLVASLTPFSDYNQSPRNMYQCQMAKQTMGTPCHSIPCRTDNKMYRIQTPQAPIVQNQRLREYQLDEYPLGTNAVVAVISYTGYDMEDAMIINKSSYERGFAHASVYKQIMVDLVDDKTRTSTSKSMKYFCNINPTTKECFTEHLDSDGLPQVGKLVHYGDPITCAIDETTGEAIYTKHKETEPAFIDQITIIGNNTMNNTNNNDNNENTNKKYIQKVSIKLRFKRNPIVGDKFSSRHGQKGVLSILWPQTDMPFTEAGLSPDIIINPHAFPSRMTIGMLIESMAAKSGAINGTYQDATPFQFNEKNRVIDHFGKELLQAGYNYMGSEPLYSGITGTIMHADIYIGIVYYQRLRHMVSDKSQVRSTGPINAVTRQPLKGRKRKGGIRFGEMERDSILAHGCAFLLQDRLLNCSDKHTAIVCKKCGSLLSTLTQSSILETAGQDSLMIATKTKYQWFCSVCKTSKYCRPISMPYVFRYLVNELAAMNIKIKLGMKSI